jgi:uncharacterized protein (UPF0332 family)
MLSNAFDIRNDSDYDDFYIAPREDALIQLENAKKFLKRIREYIETVINKEKTGEKQD